MTASRAADKAGISATVITDWKAQYPEFLELLKRAEAEYIDEKLDQLKACQTKWGTPDPKAIELELRRIPEFRQHQPEPQQAVTVNINVTPEALLKLQAMWEQSRALAITEGAK